MKFSEDISAKMQRQVLGRMLENDSLYFENHTRLRRDMFTTAINQGLYTAFEESRTTGEIADAVTLAERMQGDFTKNFDYVSDVMTSVGFEVAFDSALEYLIACYKTRKYQEILSKSLASVQSGGDVSASIEELESSIAELQTESSSGVSHISETIDRVFESIEAAQKKTGVPGIDSGFDKINQHTGGWQPSDLVILAGETSQGKTSFVLNSAMESALRSDKSWVFYSLEMSDTQLATRLLASHSRIDGKRILFGDLLEDEIAQLKYQSDTLRATNIHIVDCQSSAYSNIANSIRSMRMQGKCEIAVIDYLQLVSLPNANGREQEVGTMARNFKNLAKELNIPIIVLCQLKRNSHGTYGAPPTLSRLRDSGQIEEAADIVAFVHRPEYYGINEYENGESTHGQAEIIFAKGRNIGLDTINLHFEHKYTKFTEKWTETAF